MRRSLRLAVMPFLTLPRTSLLHLTPDVRDRISKWMSRDPVTIGPDTTVAEALNRMLFGGFRHLPVMGGDAVVGMVSMRDLARSIAEQ